jgi:hypothetical protein
MCAGVVTSHNQEWWRINPGGGYPPPADAALLTPISLAPRQDPLSRGK